MDLVSNLVGSISPSMFGNSDSGIAQASLLGDRTFLDILEEQIHNQMELDKQNLVGVQQGNLNINQELNGVNMVDKTGMIHSDTLNSSDLNANKEKTTSEVITFFNSLFESKPTLAENANTGLFQFEKKVAAGSYNKYARSVVTDLNEFVSDALKR